MLAKPVEAEPLFLYIAVPVTAVSGILIGEERTEQKPIFYVSKTLLDAETRYPMMENLALAVVMSARKLRPYFQSHTIVVLTSFPLWAIGLSQYDIEYRTKSCAKSQVLADFLVELPTGCTTNQEPDSMWTLHIDGSSSKQGSGGRVRLRSPLGEVLEQSFQLIFHASYNAAEYEALITGLRLAHCLKICNIHAYYDSQLVASQYSGEYEARDERMDAYSKLVQNMAQGFDRFALTRIPRAENVQSDALAALASSSDPGLRRVIPVEFIEHPSIGSPVIINLIESPDGDPDEVNVLTTKYLEKSEYGFDKPWTETIFAYITDGKLPAEKWAARKIKTQSTRYVLVEGELYKWRFFGPLMTCIEGEKARGIMEEVHSGSCGNHLGGRSLAIKIKRDRHFWPTMVKVCENFARKCEKCQRQAPTNHQPAEVLLSISPPYPFMRWSMDIVRPIHRSTQKLFLTDFFTKWVEADSYASIKVA